MGQPYYANQDGKLIIIIIFLLKRIQPVYLSVVYLFKILDT